MKKGHATKRKPAPVATVIKLRTKQRSGNHDRIAWHGHKRAGARAFEPLLAALMRTANENGQTLAELAAALGVTYGYLAQLNAGIRHVEHISLSFARACARYLGVPGFTVKVLARQLLAEDFAQPAELEKQNLEAGLRRVADDPLLGGFMPEVLYELDAHVQAFVLMLYQEASGVELFSYSRLPEIVQAARAAVTAAAPPKALITSGTKANDG